MVTDLGFVHHGAMNWPAPLPPPETSDPRGDAPCDDPDAPDGRPVRRGLPPATWIALLGGALILIAAASIVVTSWDTIGRSVRVAGLVLATTVLLVVSERLRRSVPATSNVMAHVGTFLTGSIGIAGMSLAGFTWPACLLVGGLTALAASALQSRRWEPELFLASQVVSISIAATGLAALTGTTGALVAVIAALGLVAVGADRRAAALAVAAVLSPILAALADAGIGAGTLRRAGVVGEQLGWSGPVVGVLAAMVLVAVGLRRSNSGLLLAAAAAPVMGVVTGLAAVDSGVIAWLCVPALCVVAAEAAYWMMPHEARARMIGVTDTVAAAVAVMALPAQFLAHEAAHSTAEFDPAIVPATLTACALAVATLRWRRAGGALVDLGTVGVAVLATTVLVLLDVPAPLVALTATALVGAVPWLGGRLSRYAVYGPMFVALAEIVGPYGPVEPRLVAVGLSVCVFATALALRGRLAATAGWSGTVEVGAVTLMATLVGASLWPDHLSAGAMIGAAAVSFGYAAIDRRHTAAALASTFGIGATISYAAIAEGRVDDFLWLGWLAVSASALGCWRSSHERVMLAAAFSAVGCSVVSLAASSGILERLQELVRPLDISAGDLWMLVATSVALVTGALLRRRVRLGSWVAYAPGITVGGLWLLTVQVERDTAWALPAALTFGIAAAGIGAWRRLAAPLAGGTAITLVTTFVATGNDLTAIPTWAWLAVGGSTLITIAVAIERAGQRETSLKDLVSRWD